MHLSHAIFQWPLGLDGKAVPAEIDYVRKGQEIWRDAHLARFPTPSVD